MTNLENKMHCDYFFYNFLCKYGDSLNYVGKYVGKEKTCEMVLKKTKKVSLLIKLYMHFNMKNKLLEPLSINENKYLLEYYVEYLKDNYHNEIYNYFESQFYTILET